MNEGLWIVKFIVTGLLFAFCLIIPMGFFSVVAEIAKFLAIILSVMIIINIVDLFYTWSEHWVGLFDKGA